MGLELLSSFIAATGMGAFAGSVMGEQFRGVLRSSCSLRHYEYLARRRLCEINEALAQVRSMRSTVEREAPTPEWQGVLAALRAAEEFYPRHRDCYRLKLFAIESTRWQNALLALASDWDELTFGECRRRLEALELLRRDGEKLANGAGVSALRETPEGILCYGRVQGALTAIEEMRKGLVARQAQSLLASALPVEAYAERRVPPLLSLEPLDLLSARAELGEFAAGFHELEAEHARLRGELDAVRQVEQLTTS
jgi:hypothetical protein